MRGATCFRPLPAGRVAACLETSPDHGAQPPPPRRMPPARCTRWPAPPVRGCLPASASAPPQPPRTRPSAVARPRKHLTALAPKLSRAPSSPSRPPHPRDDLSPASGAGPCVAALCWWRRAAMGRRGLALRPARSEWQTRPICSLHGLF